MNQMIRAKWFSKPHLLEYAVLLCILILAGYLRFYHVEDNPGWYSDEGTHLSIAQNLQQGRVQYLAVTDSFLLFARLPLFEYILSVAISLFGSSMATLRGLTAALGVLSVLTLYYVVKRIEEKRLLALLAAFLFAIYPQAVLYSRFGFSYNLLVPLILLMCLGLTEYLHTNHRRHLLLAAICVGIGLISDLIIGSMIFVVALVVLYKNPKDLLWSSVVMGLPFAIYALLMLLNSPSVFLFDLNYTMSRLGGLSLLTQAQNVTQNYTVLLSQDFWVPVGLIGLFLLPSPKLKFISLTVFFSFIFLTGRTVALYSLSAYYTIPILPLPALGVASLIIYAIPKLWELLNHTFGFILHRGLRKAVAALCIVLVLALPFITTFLITLQNIQTRIPTAIDPFLVNPQNAREVTAYIEKHSQPDDTVIASPSLAWMLDTRTADFQMSVAYTGTDAVHLPGNLPRQRFAFDPQLSSARYVIVDNMWRNWGAVHMPQVATMLDHLSSWGVVFQSGDLTVYENPN